MPHVFLGIDEESPPLVFLSRNRAAQGAFDVLSHFQKDELSDGKAASTHADNRPGKQHNMMYTCALT